ncbi:MAG: hypothetical protein ACT4PL_08910, partial [Phycisphaerales bacterium]
NPATTGSPIGKPCPADVNRDGLLTPDDLADFITAYFGDGEGISVDINGDGFVEPGDFDEFVTIFFNTGC